MTNAANLLELKPSREMYRIAEKVMAKWEISKMWHDHREALRKHTDEKGRHTPAKSKTAKILKGNRRELERAKVTGSATGQRYQRVKFLTKVKKGLI